jgi:hypothetical protein
MLLRPTSHDTTARAVGPRPIPPHSCGIRSRQSPSSRARIRTLVIASRHCVRSALCSRNRISQRTTSVARKCRTRLRTSSTARGREVDRHIVSFLRTGEQVNSAVSHAHLYLPSSARREGRVTTGAIIIHNALRDSLELLFVIAIGGTLTSAVRKLFHGQVRPLICKTCNRPTARAYPRCRHCGSSL